MPTLSFLALLFYLVFVIDGSIYGTPESEVEEVISTKILQAITLSQKAELQSEEAKRTQDSEID